MRKRICLVLVFILMCIGFTQLAAFAQTGGDFNVSFSSGGGIGTAPASFGKNAGETFVLPETTLFKLNDSFWAWSDGETCYASGSSYTMPARSVEFVAVWRGDDTVKITVPSVNAALNSEVTLDVCIDNLLGAAGGSFNVVYDNAALQLVSCTKGSAYGSIQPFINSSYAANRIRFSWTSSAPLVSGVLITLKFKAVKAASAAVTLEKLKLYTIGANEIQSSVINGSVNIDTVKKDITAGEVTVKNSNSVAVQKISNGSFSAAVPVTNGLSSDKAVSFYAASFDKNGALAAVKISTKTVLSGKTENIPLDFSVNADVFCVNLFVLEDGSIRPICGKTVLGR